MCKLFFSSLFRIVCDSPIVAPGAMGGVSKTESNLTHFYTTHHYLLDICKDLAKMNPKQC